MNDLVKIRITTNVCFDSQQKLRGLNGEQKKNNEKSMKFWYRD